MLPSSSQRFFFQFLKRINNTYGRIKSVSVVGSNSFYTATYFKISKTNVIQIQIVAVLSKAKFTLCMILWYLRTWSVLHQVLQLHTVTLLIILQIIELSRLCHN